MRNYSIIYVSNMIKCRLGGDRVSLKLGFEEGYCWLFDMGNVRVCSFGDQ